MTSYIAIEVACYDCNCKILDGLLILDTFVEFCSFLYAEQEKREASGCIFTIHSFVIKTTTLKNQQSIRSQSINLTNHNDKS